MYYLHAHAYNQQRQVARLVGKSTLTAPHEHFFTRIAENAGQISVADEAKLAVNLCLHEVPHVGVGIITE